MPLDPPLPNQNGLKWVDEMMYLAPAWTIGPDMSTAKALALLHIPQGVDYTISPFSSGAFNKLYILSPIDSSSPDSYIMRVSLPVDPYFKTASEVATLKYVLRHTSIPVPRVIAFDASSENDLGFEWILMTRLEGVALKTLWSLPELTWDDRVRLTETVAGYVTQLKGLQFDKLGSLYLSDEEHAPLHWLDKTTCPHSETTRDVHFTPLEDDPAFAIGPVVSLKYSYGNRFKLATDRGPFQSSSAWLATLLRLQVAATNDEKENPPEGGYDSSDISELDGMIQAANNLLHLMPIVFPPEIAPGNETFVLYHDDLSLNNLLIDPKTHRITGLVDWECVHLHPVWKARRYPQFIFGPEINEELYEASNNVPVPAIPEPPNPDEENVLLVEEHDLVERMLLRRVFDGVVPVDVEQDLLKRIFENKVQNSDLELEWSGTIRLVPSPSGSTSQSRGQNGLIPESTRHARERPRSVRIAGIVLKQHDTPATPLLAP